MTARRTPTGSIPPTDERSDEAVRDALAQAALARVPAPAVPAGLAARIIRDVPRLPQLPADGAQDAPVPVTGHLGPKIVALPVRTRAADAAVPAGSAAGTVLPSPVSRPPVAATPAVHHPMPPRRSGWSLSGFGAMAAGLAAVVALGLSLREVAPPAVPSGQDAAVVALASPGAAVASAAGAASPAAATSRGISRLAADESARTASANRAGASVLANTGSAATGGTDLAVAAPVAGAAGANVQGKAVTAPEQLAAGPVQGAPDVGASGTTLVAPLGARGVMGPVLPQGYGYTGSAGLPEISGGAPVRMSGGPGPAPGAGPGPGPGGPH